MVLPCAINSTASQQVSNENQSEPDPPPTPTRQATTDGQYYDDQKVTLRCGLLNIQGLRTKRTNKLLSEELAAVFKNHDILLLTETWSNDYDDLSVNNFEHFALHRTENVHSSKRSSGGLVYVRSELVSSDTLVFQSQDDIACIKINGDLLGLQTDLYVCLSYVIPENSSRQAHMDTHTFDRLLDFIVTLDSKHDSSLPLNFVLCGDLNSRTSNMPDFDDSSFNSFVLPDDYVPDINSN